MPASPTAPPRRSLLAILIAVTSLGPLALNIFVPSMPGLQRFFAAGYETVQLTLTVYFIALAGAQLVCGPLSDRFGRRPTMFVGLSFFLVGSLACLLAPTIEALIVGRVVQAIGAGAGLVLCRAIVRDLYEREDAATVLAYITMAMVVAPTLAPALGGYLDVWFGWRASFALISAAGAAVLAATLWGLSETHHHRAVLIGMRGLVGSFGHLLRIPSFCGYAFQMAFTSGVFFAFVGGAPYVMVELMGRPASEYGLYFVFGSCMYMAGNYTAARASARLVIDRMILIGTLISLFGALGLGAVTAMGGLTPLTLFSSMAVVALGNGMSLPNGLAGAVSVDPARAGSASGLSGFLQMTAAAGFSYVVGALLADSATPLVIAMIVGAVLALAAHVFGVRLGGGAR